MADVRHTILLVEDDADVRASLTDLIQLNGHHCLQANNGCEGLSMATEHEPDIIITDIVMPKMDGFEMVKALLNDMQIAHIPIIILTAKSQDKYKLEGLELGAVDYLLKPFNSRELILKVRNILKHQENVLQGNWKKIFNSSIKDSVYEDDKLFIESLHNKVLDRMGSTSFGVSELADELNMSERNLYRKIKELFGMPVATYIREVRLQRAHQLLEKNSSISKAEVAYEVGYRSPRHFAKAYQKRFGG